MDKMSERLDSMELTLHNLTLEREQMQQTHQQELEKLQTEFDNEINMCGLTRRTLISDKWHEKNHHMSNYLFGFEKWEYFKVFVECAFCVNVNVKGKGKIMPFEKVCMVAMMARRAYCCPSHGGIYNRTPSAITGYLKEWVPVFGRVGQYLSELSLEKTHNFIDEETAREWKVKYIYPDGTVVDFANL
jgi:hypothetical protein